MIENFDEKPVTTVGFVIGVPVSSERQRRHVDLGRAHDAGADRLAAHEVGRRGAVRAGDFQSPWKTDCGSLLKPGAPAPPTS